MNKPYDDSHAEDRRNASAGLTPTIYESVKRSSDAYAMLSGVIEAAKDDPSKLRRLVYDVAWTMFVREAEQKSPPLSPSELVAGARALEAAIARVETDYAQFELPPPPPRRIEQVPPPPPPPPPHTPVTIVYDGPGSSTTAGPLALRRQNEHSAWDVHVERLDRPNLPRRPRRIWLRFVVWPLVQFAAISAVVLLLIGLYTDRIDFNSQWSQAVEPFTGRSPDGTLVSLAPPAEPRNEQPAQSKAAAAGLPLPTAYGVYAVSHDKLHVLEPLPIKVPHPRIQLSGNITKPSQTVLPDGKLAFIVYRRELVNRAPERVPVRVVAKVARKLSYKASVATITKVQGVWRIRANSYDLKVAPLGDNREMIVLRPEASDFTFPAGRYALVLKGIGYDFSVAGPLTVAEHCLEVTETANGTLYGQCRKP